MVVQTEGHRVARLQSARTNPLSDTVAETVEFRVRDDPAGLGENERRLLRELGRMAAGVKANPAQP
jgi:hypothetical protein